MSLAERLLLGLSRAADAPDYHLSDDDVGVENALHLLSAQFGTGFVDAHVRDRRVLDYGCGYGKQAVAYLLHGAAHVTSVDIRPENIEQARGLAGRWQVADRLSFLLGDVDDVEMPRAAFDTAVTSDAFEHFGDPDGVLRVCRRALRPGGRLVITFGDPWYHPYGCHMQFFTRLPWTHVLFSERTVMKVRARFRHDGARRYGEVAGGLNQMTVRRFERLVQHSGMHVEHFELRGIRRKDALTCVPGLREFFTNRVNCILRKP